MTKKQKQLLIAIILGLVVFFLNKAYLDNRISEVTPKNMTAVVIAKKRILAGSPLAAGAVKTVKVPAKYVPKARITSGRLGEFIGQPVSIDILAGDYVLESYFEPIGTIGATLSDQLEEREGQTYRAISLPVDETNSFARSIVTGDKIDVVFTFTTEPLKQKLSILLLQNVPVIATGSYSVAEQEMGTRGTRMKRYNTLTLRLTAEDAMRLNYARQSGKIDVLLRNPKDNRIMDLKPVGNVLDLLNAADREMVKAVEQSQLEAARLEEERFKEQVQKLMELQRQQQRSQ